MASDKTKSDCLDRECELSVLPVSLHTWNWQPVGRAADTAHIKMFRSSFIFWNTNASTSDNTVCTWVCRGNTSRNHKGSMQFNLGEFSHKQDKISACQMFNLKSGQNIQPVFPMLTLFYAEFIWFDRDSVTRIKSCTGMWLCIFELTVPSSWSQWVMFHGFSFKSLK